MTTRKSGTFQKIYNVHHLNVRNSESLFLEETRTQQIPCLMSSSHCNTFAGVVQI